MFIRWICGPCKIMKPVIELLADQFNGTATVGKLNVDTNPETTARYGIRFLIFKNGQIAERIVGAVPMNLLAEKIKAPAL